MKKHIFHIIFLLFAVLFFSSEINAQIKLSKKSWLSGYARSVLLSDKLNVESENDSISAKRINSGHTLLDLTANIQPNESIYIHGSVRIRNDHGGFWGSGVSFDVRNLYIRGLIANAIRFQLGDVQYKLTPFTFFNNPEETYLNQAKIFNIQSDLIHTDLFYDDENNTWRQQGLTTDFGLSFKKGLKEINTNAFLLRLAPGLNGNLDKLFGGFHVDLIQSKYLDGHVNYVNTFDIEDTGNSENRFGNSVITGGIGLHYLINKKWRLSFNSEIGSSKQHAYLDQDSLERDDFFIDLKASVELEPSGLKLTAGYQDVGTDFRSVGAQTRRLRTQAQPRAFSRIGNDQVLRPLGLVDAMRDASVYNTKLSENLMDYSPSYNNYQPYGIATPNRKSIYTELSILDEKERFEGEIKYSFAKEILGQGTAELKTFNEAKIGGVMHLESFIKPLKKKLDIKLGYRWESTKREGESEFEFIDLTNQQINVGLNIGLWDKFELLSGIQWFKSNGNEYKPRLNDLDQIFSFEQFNSDLSERLIGLGLSYNFTEKIFLNFNWNQYSYSNKISIVPEYSISTWSILFNMKI